MWGKEDELERIKLVFGWWWNSDCKETNFNISNPCICRIPLVIKCLLFSVQTNSLYDIRL